MSQLIQVRRGTAAAWTTANPVLSAGEPGFETDTGKFKFGDGATAWASLPYFSTTVPTAPPNPAPVFPVSTGFFFTQRTQASSGSATPSGTLYAIPVTLGKAITLTQLDVNVQTAGDAGSVVRVGVYGDTGTFGPGSRLLDAGTVATATTGIKTITGLSLALSAGTYWLAAAVQTASTAPLMYTQTVGDARDNPMGVFDSNSGFVWANGATASVTGFSKTGVTGALPASYGTPTANETKPIKVVGRAA